MSLLPDLGPDKDPDAWIHRELTTSEALLCVAYLEGYAVRKLLSTPRVLDNLIREYMVEWTTGTDTSRAEFTETVVRMLTGRWGV